MGSALVRSRQLVQLTPDQATAALAYCARRPYHTTFAAGWLSDGGLLEDPRTPRAWLFADQDAQGEICGLVYLSDTGILLPMLEDEGAIDALVDIGRRNPHAIRVIVGERRLVRRLWNELTPLGFVDRISRDQLGYGVARAAQFDVGEMPLVAATVDSLDQIVSASAAMAREEARDDPQARNPSLFRTRIRERIERGRDFVFDEAGHVLFKCNVSALSAHGGQIEGIYTLPDYRRAGIGRLGTAAITKWVLDRSERAFLLVNDDNHVARRLYEALGYRAVLESRTIFVAP